MGVNYCNSKWIIYGLCCVSCDKWYIGKTYNSFKVRFSNHRSKIKKKIEEGTITDADSTTEGEVHLWNHFVTHHNDISTLKWVIIDKRGKETYDPSGNLLVYEHAYIDYFNVKYPNGLNKLD